MTNGAVPVLLVDRDRDRAPDPSRGSFLVTFDDRVQASAAARGARTKEGFATGVTMSSSDIPYLNVTTAAFAEVFTGAGGTIEKDLSSTSASTFLAQVDKIAAMEPHHT